MRRQPTPRVSAAHVAVRRSRLNASSHLKVGSRLAPEAGRGCIAAPRPSLLPALAPGAWPGSPRPRCVTAGAGVPSALWIGDPPLYGSGGAPLEAAERASPPHIAAPFDVGWVLRNPPQRPPLMLYPYKPLLVPVDASSVDLLRALDKMLRLAGIALSNDELGEALALRLQIMLAHHRNERARTEP
jgi:hypothetical protein